MTPSTNLLPPSEVPLIILTAKDDVSGKKPGSCKVCSKCMACRKASARV